MFDNGVPPVIVIILLAQSLFLAGWAVVSIGIVWGVIRQARAAKAAGPDDAPQASAFMTYLRDPQTRFRRWIWLGLTFGLLAIGLGLNVTIRQV